jgi:hypothetical protein
MPGRIDWENQIGKRLRPSTSRAHREPSNAYRRCRCQQYAARPQPAHGRICGHSRASHCAQFNASILELKGFDQLGTMGGQAILKIDPSKGAGNWRR